MYDLKHPFYFIIDYVHFACAHRWTVHLLIFHSIFDAASQSFALKIYDSEHLQTNPDEIHDSLELELILAMEAPWKPSHAIAPVAYTTLLFGTGLLYFSFPRQINRHGALLCVIVFAVEAFRSSADLLPDSMVEDMFCRTILIFVAHFWHLSSSRAKLTSSKYHNPQADLKVHYASPWMRGYKLLFNARGLGTSWEIAPERRKQFKPQAIEIKKTEGSGAIHSITLPSTRTMITSRTYTLLRWAGLLTVQYFLLCFWHELRWTAYIDLNASDFNPEKEVLLRRIIGLYPGAPVTGHELHLRTRATIDHVVSDYLKISLMHSFCGIVFVALGLDDLSEWPPLFGSLRVRSMRAYWAEFWHTLVYASFLAHAGVILSWVGLQGKRGPAIRLAKNWLVFALSAVMHGLVDVQMSPCGLTRSLWWWVMQPAAFVIEALVSWAWKKSMHKYRGFLLVRVFEVTVSHVWVFAWLFWRVPKRLYPLFTCGITTS